MLRMCLSDGEEDYIPMDDDEKAEVTHMVDELYKLGVCLCE